MRSDIPISFIGDYFGEISCLGSKHSFILFLANLWSHSTWLSSPCSCLVGGIRRAGVKALSTCELQALSRRNVNSLIIEYPDVGEELKRVTKDRAKIVKEEKKEVCRNEDTKLNRRCQLGLLNWWLFTTYHQWNEDNKQDTRYQGKKNVMFRIKNVIPIIL